MKVEERGRTVGPFDHPLSLLQDGDDVLPLHGCDIQRTGLL